jgi:DNA-binding NtrC family response regulator
MHRAVLLGRGTELGPDAILLTGQRTAPAETLASASATDAARAVVAPAGAAPLVGRTVAAVERDLILETLSHCLGNRTHAANILGISIRTLRNKLKQYSTEGVPLSDGTSELERQAV